MKYLNKPSEKIICTESNGSIKLNSLYPILTVTLLAVFFLHHHVSRSPVYPASHVKKYQSMNNF